MQDLLKNNYHKHLIIGVLLGMLIVRFGDLKTSGVVAQLLIPTFLVFMIAGFWEAYWGMKKDAPLDLKDIFWSCVGAFCGALILISLW